MKFANIRKLMSYQRPLNPISCPLGHFESFLKRTHEDIGLNLNPDFQRGHVWSETQQIKFIEFLLKGGTMPTIFFNCPSYMGYKKSHSDLSDEVVIVDGLQRLTAIRKFLANEIKAFGYCLDEFEDKILIVRGIDIKYAVNELQTREELLTWYLEINEGQVAHTKEELERVRDLLNQTYLK